MINLKEILWNKSFVGSRPRGAGGLFGFNQKFCGVQGQVSRFSKEPLARYLPKAFLREPQSLIINCQLLMVNC